MSYIPWLINRYTIIWLAQKLYASAGEQSHGLGIPLSGIEENLYSQPDEQSHGLGIPFSGFNTSVRLTQSAIPWPRYTVLWLLRNVVRLINSMSNPMA